MFDHVAFVTPVLSVEPAWIDGNGHLNMAYYAVLFDRAVDAMLDACDLGEAYRRRAGCSFFVVEMHLRNLAEVLPDEQVRVGVRVVAEDARRVQVFLEMRDASSGRLNATCEQMLLHTRLDQRKAAALDTADRARLAAFAAADADRPLPEGLGRRIAMRRDG